MRLLYITSPSFFDADLSYIKSLSNLIEVTVLLDLPKHGLNKTALAIAKQNKRSGIIDVTENEEFHKYRIYIKDKIFTINRPKSKLISRETLIIQWEIKKIIKTINPDLIHYNNFCDLSYISALFNNCKKVLTVHDPIPHIGDTKRNLFNRRLNLRFIKKIIILNEFQRKEFIKRYNLKSSNVYNSKLSIYESYKDLYLNISAQTRISSSSSNDFNILFFGRITDYKGIDILIKAFQLLRKKIPQANLTIAGEGYYDFSKLNLTNVQLHNRYIETSELYHLINDSTFVVCPYIEATQSGVVMTAFSLLKPVIATKVGGLPEMVEDNKTGILVNPNNSVDLSAAMTELLKNESKRHIFADNIRQLYFNQGKYSWNTIADNMLLIYNQVIR